MSVRPLVAALVLAAATDATAASPPPLLIREPTLSRTQICFSYAGDLWIVARKGGDARRLTTHVVIVSNSLFSPVCSLIAFTGEYDVNHDVFVVSAEGGMPRRLTTHPGGDEVAGWSRDGKRVLF